MTTDRADALDRPSGLWWLNPVALAVALPLGTLLLSLAFDDTDFRRLWRSPKVVTDLEFTQLLVGASLLVLGSAVVQAFLTVRRSPSYGWFSRRELRLMNRAAIWFFWLTNLGYVAFLVQAIRAHITLTDLILTAQGIEPPAGPIELRLTTLPGISTLTQLGVAFAVLAVILRGCHQDDRLRRRLLLMLVVVFGWAFVRAIALTERLAILEILIPMIAASCLMHVPGSRAHRRDQLLPVILGPFVIGVFALFEHSRSWQWYSTHGSTNFGRFVLERFAGYYVTAVNNGAMRMQHQTRGVLPYDTMELLWRAPVVSQLGLYEKLTGLQGNQDYADNLTRYTTQEFNNPSGLSNPFTDYTTSAAWLYLLLMGLLIGLLYVGYRRRSPLGVLLYPLAFITLLEMPRYLWWCQGRSLPPLAALAAVGAVLAWRRRRDDSIRREM